MDIIKILALENAHWIASIAFFVAAQTPGMAAERTERFDKDPGWLGHNNRAASPVPRSVRQDFGYSASAHTGGRPGEMGGLITAAAEPAFYARKIPRQSFDDALGASGKLACPTGRFHILVGFFNADTLNEWRTPNTIALRLQGRGDFFYAFVEYCTSRWRGGGDSPGGFSQLRDAATGRLRLKGFPSGANVHSWSLRYDPKGNAGNGRITVVLDNETSVCDLAPGHKADGAVFNRFGLLNVMKSADNAGEVWLDDLTVNGEPESFERDPRWDEFHNHRTYVTDLVRPRFDFGYSATHYAGGQGPGEMGGIIFRGDGRFTNLMAYYGAPLESLTLAKRLKAAGKVSLRRGVSDSDVLFGFFHSEHSLNSGGSDAIGTPPDFLGVAIGGPSREGFMFAPAYRLHDTQRKNAERGPYLLPNGTPHDWSFEYSPGSAAADGSITVTLDAERVKLRLPHDHQAAGAHFDRFGLISTHTDGNSQSIYFDDLTYTWTQAR